MVNSSFLACVGVGLLGLLASSACAEETGTVEVSAVSVDAAVTEPPNGYQVNPPEWVEEEAYANDQYFTAYTQNTILEHRARNRCDLISYKGGAMQDYQWSWKQEVVMAPAQGRRDYGAIDDFDPFGDAREYTTADAGQWATRVKPAVYLDGGWDEDYSPPPGNLQLWYHMWSVPAD